MFSNWLIATIIHSFSNVKKTEKKTKETQGKNYIPFLEEDTLRLLYKKFIRNFLLLVKVLEGKYKFIENVNKYFKKKFKTHED